MIRAGALLLICAGLVTYHNSFHGPFILDDVRAIPDNPEISRVWPIWHAMMAPPNSGLTTRPIVMLSLAANYAMDGLNVRGYHVVNLAIHILAGLVLYGIVRRMLESDPLRIRYGAAAPWLALAAAGIWIVHPLQTESVTYIVQRAESLMGLLYLLTLYCAIRGFQSPHPVWWYLAAVIACALGMGAKEVMVTAPVMVFLYDRLFVSRSLRHLIRQRWGFYAGLAATWVVLIVVLAVLRSERQMVLIEDLGPWRYALTQFGVIVHYLRLSYWPSSLVLDYLWPLAHGVSSILPWAIIVLALIGATVWALLRGNWVGFWGAWFFLILAPTSSVVPIADAAFEHRMYLSLAAVVVLSVIGGYELMRWAGRRFSVPDHVQGWVAVGLVLSVIAVLGALTIRRNEDYRSELAINRDVVAKRPDNPRGHNNLGLALNTLGQAAEAEDHFRTAVRLRPDVAEAQANLGAALLRRRQVDQAIVHLSEATRLKPALPEPHRDLGLALIERGDVQGAIRQFGLLLQLRPDDVNARSELASALLKAGWSKQAVPRLVASLSGDPKSSQAHFDRADALFLQGMYKASVPEYLEALRVNPRFAEAHNNLAMAMYTLGDVDGAVAHLSTALRLKPDYATAFYNLGTILYRQGHVKESVNHFAQAVRLDPALVEARDSLRAAQATLGKAGAKP